MQEYAAAHSHNVVHITVTASQPMPNLPAAAEVAAYRIAIEAITNVVRHAQAHHYLVHLKINNGLQLEIREDGIGLAVDYQPGIGLSSMRERNAEQSGTFQIESTPGRGTTILVKLPFTHNQPLTPYSPM